MADWSHVSTHKMFRQNKKLTRDWRIIDPSDGARPMTMKRLNHRKNQSTSADGSSHTRSLTRAPSLRPPSRVFGAEKCSTEKKVAPRAEREREIGRKRVSHEMLHAPERQLLTDVSGADKMLISFLPTPQNEYANFFLRGKKCGRLLRVFSEGKKNVVFPRFERNVSDKLSTARPQTATCRPLNPFVTVLCCH